MSTRILAAFAGLLLCGVALPLKAETKDPLEVFEQRIMPIFKSPKPSSCVQCHLAAVDLKDYILPSSEATFASLNAQGLVDLDNPKKSKILNLIAMGDRDRDEKAKRIHEANRRAEFQAFAAWIEACCNDPRLRKLGADKQVAKPARPNEVIRHARKSRVVDSFVRKIWSQRMRCFPCHTPHELDPNNPKHKNAIRKVAEFEEKHGKEYAERLRIFRDTPEATLAYLIEDSKNTPSNRLPLLNLAEPQRSLLLLKPMAKLPKRKANKQFEDPSYLEPVSHMGGLKIHVDDPAHKSFVSWISDYANVVGNKYVAVGELPADNWAPTQQFLMVFNTPKAWTTERAVQMMVHAWDAKKEKWTEEPVAFTQNHAGPRGRVVAPLLLLRGAAANSYFAKSEKGQRLAAGKYLIKAYLDTKGKLHKDPTLFLPEADYFGQVVVEAKWQEGIRGSQKVSGASIVAKAGAE